MKKTILIDANVIIRYLLNDNPKLSPRAKLIFQKAERGELKLFIDEVIVAEVVWTFSSFYKLKKGEIVDKLEKLLSMDWIENPKKRLMLMTFDLYKSTNLSYIDCWIYVMSKSLKIKLETFDEDLKKLQ